MKMTMEETHARFVWYVLDKIKGQILLNKDNSNCIAYNLFLYPQSNGWDKPNSIIEQKIIGNLIDWKVIEKINDNESFQTGIEDKTGNPKSAGSIYYFKIDDAVFNKYYGQFKQLVEQYDRANYEGNTLYFNDNGEILYICSTGKTYKTKLRANTNNFNLLKFLAYNPHHVFTFNELSKYLKEVRSDVDFSDDDRRVRDTIKGIKDKLKYRGDDLFESNNGFGLKCNVLIKK